MALTLLRAGFAALPCAGWYAQQLLNAHERGCDLGRFPPPSEDAASALEERLDEWANEYVPYGECLYQEANLADPAGCDATRLLAHFRNLCSLAWRLQARDKLSTLMRQRAEFADDDSEAWLELNFDCLVWCQHLLPFASMLPTSQRGELFHALLSVLLEFEPEPALADVLVTWGLTPDGEHVSPDVVDRLDDLLDEWKEKYLEGSERKTILTRHHRRRAAASRLGPRQLVHRGETMSSHFYARLAARDEERQHWADTFGEVDQFVRLDGTSLAVGGRFFEVEMAYLDFVSMLYSVGLAKALDAAVEAGGAEQTQPTPLLLAFSVFVSERELRDGLSGSLPASPRSPRPPIPSPRYQRSLSAAAPGESRSVPRSNPRPLSARSAKTQGPARRERSGSVCSLRLNAASSQAPSAVPALNLSELTAPRRPASNFGGRRASLSDIRSAMQPTHDAFLFTPRAGSVAKGSTASKATAPAPIAYPLDFDLPPLRQDLYDRLTWLVRWSLRQPVASLCRQGVAASIRLRLNPSVIMYAAFGVKPEARRASLRRIECPPPQAPPTPKQATPKAPPPRPIERHSSRESLFSEESSGVTVSGYSERLRTAARRHFAEFVAEHQQPSSSASKNGPAPSEVVDEDDTLAESMSEGDRDSLRFSVDLGKCTTLQSNK